MHEVNVDALVRAAAAAAEGQLFAEEVQPSLALAQGRLAEAQTQVGQGRPRPQRTRDVDMQM